jgi:hypothetical protein
MPSMSQSALEDTCACPDGDHDGQVIRRYLFTLIARSPQLSPTGHVVTLELFCARRQELDPFLRTESFDRLNGTPTIRKAEPPHLELGFELLAPKTVVMCMTSSTLTGLLSGTQLDGTENKNRVCRIANIRQPATRTKPTAE